MAAKKWVVMPRGSERRCPKCKKNRVVQMFRRADNPLGWCNSCRGATGRPKLKLELELELESVAGEINLGSNRILRISVIGDVVTLVSGRVVERITHENDLLTSVAPQYRGLIVNVSPMFQSDCSTLTVPLRLLDKLRDALAQTARKYPVRKAI